MTVPDSAARWRYRRPPRQALSGPEGPATADHAASLDAAWRQLLIGHTPFRATEQREFLQLTADLRHLEEVFLAHPDLAAYYDECLRDDRPPDGQHPVDGQAAGDASASGCPVDRPPADEPPADAPAAAALSAAAARARHAAMLQAQLMEEVFYALRLDRYANAPENRGWMNLFRRWGRSAAFNAQFARIRTTFTPGFGAFYTWYLRDLEPVDRQPVPHRWDAARAAYGAPALCSDDDAHWAAATRSLFAARAEARAEARRAPVRPEAGDRSAEPPADRAPADGGPAPGRGGRDAPPPRPAAAPEPRWPVRRVPGVLLDSGILVLPPHVPDTARGTGADVLGTPVAASPPGSAPGGRADPTDPPSRDGGGGAAG